MRHISLRPVIGLYSQKLQSAQSGTWTIASFLSVLLHTLETEYGPLKKDFTLVGIEFGEDGPYVWFPGRSYILIRLSSDASHDQARAMWQLAHEAVHLLAPTGASEAPVVEEGLACLFADKLSVEEALGYLTNEASYISAMRFTRQWLEAFPDAIRRTRLVQPYFSRWTPELLQQICPGTPDALARSLCAPFVKGIDIVSPL